jgi:hypothetical protein
VDNGAGRDRNNDQDDDHAKCTGQSVASPVPDVTTPAFDTAKNSGRPKAMIARPVFADEIMDLAEDLQAGEPYQPPFGSQLLVDGVVESQQGVVGHGRPEEQSPQHSEQYQ